MIVAFRVDSSSLIGGGHLHRCINLAKILRRFKIECIFICRKHSGNLNDLVIQNKFRLIELPRAIKLDLSLKSYQKWLAVSWKKDLEQTQKGLRKIKVNLMIVDHYAIDHRWERTISSIIPKLAIIDDLCNRKHYCEILIDYSPGRVSSEYKNLLEKATKSYLGCKYNLISENFLKEKSIIKNRQKNGIKNILLTMGSFDRKKKALKSLLAIQKSNLEKDSIKVTVVMGKYKKDANEIKKIINQLTFKVNLIFYINNMHKIMKNTDLAISACGTTIWELFCMGVPTIAVVIAKNQINNSRYIERKKYALVLDKDLNFEANLISYINKIDHNKNLLNNFSFKGSNLIDGKGAQRVASIINTNMKKI